MQYCWTNLGDIHVPVEVPCANKRKTFLPADWYATIFQWAQTWLWFVRDVLKTEPSRNVHSKLPDLRWLRQDPPNLNMSHQCLPLQQPPPSSYQVTLPVQHSPDSSWWNLGNVHILSPVISPDLPRDMFPVSPKKNTHNEYEPPDSCRSKWSEVRYLQTRSESSFPGRFFWVEV